MDRFIEITDKIDGHKAVIDANRIILVLNEDGVPEIVMDGLETSFHVAETYEEIRELLRSRYTNLMSQARSDLINKLLSDGRITINEAFTLADTFYNGKDDIL